MFGTKPRSGAWIWTNFRVVVHPSACIVKKAACGTVLTICIHRLLDDHAYFMGPSVMSRSLAVCPIPIIQGAITLGVMQMLFANGWLSILGFSVWALQSLTHHRWRLPHDHPALRLRAVQATGLCASIAPLQPSRSRHSNYWNCLWVRVQFIDATIPLKIYATTCTRFHTNLTIIATNIWLIDARNYWTLKK